MTEYATRPADAPPWDDGPDDTQLAAEDAEHQAAMAQIRFNEAVADRARFLRIDREARARLRAEAVTDTDFDSLYLDREQLRRMPAPVPLIQDVLPRNVYGILRGRDQSFKSFVAIDWAACLATGKRWQDHDLEPTRVLYIAGEGADGLAKRLEAWETAWNHTIAPDMFVTRKLALNMYEPGPAFDHLLDHVSTGGYGLVVIDTLRRVSGRADGNGSEMGTVIDNLDQIKQVTANGSVLVISHTDKQDNDSRGYSGIEDDADVVWHARRDEMRLRLELTKMKDGPDGRALHLEAVAAERSLILQAAAGSEAAVSNENQLAVLDALRHTYRDGASPNDLIKATGIAKPTLYRTLHALADLGHITNTGTKRRQFYEIPPMEDTPDDTSDSSETSDPESHHD